MKIITAEHSVERVHSGGEELDAADSRLSEDSATDALLD
jgi:hypothetical protein